jgi:hypothetical protein
VKDATHSRPINTARKRVATAQARAARRGITLHQIEGDDGDPLFIGTFHALTKQFSDLAEVDTWLDHVDRRHQEIAA